MKILRVVGLFLANLLVAVMGTALVESAILPDLSRRYLGLLIGKEVIVAFTLGILGYRLMKSATANWVWLGGLCWFGSRVIEVWFHGSAVRAVTGGHDLVMPAQDWIIYGITFGRTVFYSLGAFVSCRVVRKMRDPRSQAG